MKVIAVNGNEAGQRLDKLLAKYLNLASKGFIYKMLRKKNITLNGKKASGSERLEVGDEVRLFLSDETLEKFSRIQVHKAVRTVLSVLYEDEDVLILNKPVGILSQKAKDTDESMVERVIAYVLNSGRMTEEDLRSFQPSVCNRLDRNTSGIMAAGISLRGLQEMNRMFRERAMHKYYLCVVNGVLTKTERIQGFLTKDEKTNQVTITDQPCSEDSQRIETEYTPVSNNGVVTLLKVWLITGRSHQIRAHLASVGYPIIGDKKYGNWAVNQTFLRKYQVSSQMLHSSELHMPKITEGLEQLSEKVFYAPLPEIFERVLKGEGVIYGKGVLGNCETPEQKFIHFV